VQPRRAACATARCALVAIRPGSERKIATKAGSAPAVTPLPYDRPVALHVTTTAHGAPALDALAAAVRRAQGGDPLASVAVVVPTNTAGVMARRALGRRGGFAAIDVLTMFRLAELLGAPALHARDRRPVSTPVVDVAVRQVLREHPGLYAGVQHHPSTVVALRDLYRELRIAGPGAVTALARTERGGEPARVAAEVMRALRTGWYDEGDLLEAATVRATTDLPARLSRLVVHLPQRLRPLERDLLTALAGGGDVEVIIGLTGDGAADADVLALAAELAGGPVPAAPPPDPPGDRLAVVSTTDADDEVRIAVRAVLDAARDGTPFDRTAIIFPSDRPYARLVEHHLDAAGIPWNGRPGTTVAERMAPRVLVELLGLDRRGVRRADLMALLADVPAVRAGRRVPTARWERISRRAGVVREGDWAPHLARFAADARSDEERPFRRFDADAADDLAAFVAELRAELGDPGAARAWAEWRAWSLAMLDRWFGPGRLDRLDGAEAQAWAETTRVLDRLHHLDDLGPPVTREEFRTTFAAELDVTPGRHGKLGDGVHVSTLAGAAGLDVDVAVVLGAADGLVPPAPVIDPLLGDQERRAAGLAVSDHLTGLVHRQFLAATTATPRALVTVPRGDLRATAVRQPTRWLAPLAAVERVVDSHAHGLAETTFPVSGDEHRLRELWVRGRAGEDVRTTDAVHRDGALARAIALRDARTGAAFTVYDGNLTGHPIGTLHDVVSPTQLEAWPACPHAYFVQYVLGVRRVEDPEDIETLSPLDRGAALHAAIDRLHQAVLAGELPAPGATGWGDEHRAFLRLAGAEVAADLEHRGRTGRAAFWANERVDLDATLERWLDFENRGWRGGRIVASELSFGDPPVQLALPDGRTIGFRGQIDRVDELHDGRLVVTDHKTGKSNGLDDLTTDDPTLAATHFQLPVYAAAARQALHRPDATVEVGYTFFRPFKRTSVVFDEEVWKRVGESLADVVAGIEGGVFPARPARPGFRMYVPCWYCEPDGLGTAARWSEWERKRHDPALIRWFADPEDPA
jgi:ATP-dependent helicase/nuclease subunit B